MAFVMIAEVMGFSRDMYFLDGTPCAVKVARTVWTGGKDGDIIKVLPIGIIDIADTSAVKRCVWRLCG